MARGALELACIGVLFAAVHAVAANVSCSQPLGEELVDGNLTADGVCELAGTEVNGNVTVAAGASLTASDAWIRGNLTTKSASFVELRTTIVDGNARFERTAGTSSIDDTRVNGNVTIDGSRALWELTDNSFGGNLAIAANAGGVVLDGNAVRGKLECDDNVPAPVGARNEFRNGARGQCAALGEDSAPRPKPPAKPDEGKPAPAKPEPPAVKPPEPRPSAPTQPAQEAPAPAPVVPAPRPAPAVTSPAVGLPFEPAPPPAPSLVAVPPQRAEPGFTPQPEGGGGGAVGLLELLCLPLVLALHCRKAQQRRARSRAALPQGAATP